MNKLQKPVLAALFTALIIVGAIFSIPTGLVPFTLAIFFVWLAGIILGPFWGAVSVGMYLVLGLFLPVFSNGSSGLTALQGYTGGFLVGYLLSAITVGLLRDKTGVSILKNVFALLAGFVVLYAIGLPWMHMVLSGAGKLKTPTDPLSTIYIMWIYIIFDMVKIIIAAFLAKVILKLTSNLSTSNGH